MGLFKNASESHQHSLEVLNSLYEYDSFLDSLTVIADMGCGAALDAQWWAQLTTRDDIPEPHNYVVYAVDQTLSQIEEEILLKNPNIKPILGNFEENLIPRKVDLMWAHDSFQYSRNPYDCLATWKRSMNLNGMLVLSIPQTTYLDQFGKLRITSLHGQNYSYNILNLMYMLAVSGFDCNDAYFYRKPGTPWLYAAVYATEHDPMPANTSWHQLAEMDLVNDSIKNSLNKYDYARLEDTMVVWLDRNYHIITS
jgi:SAM-dependent methyltransferase